MAYPPTPRRGGHRRVGGHCPICPICPIFCFRKRVVGVDTWSKTSPPTSSSSSSLLFSVASVFENRNPAIRASTPEPQPQQQPQPSNPNPPTPLPTHSPTPQPANFPTPSLQPPTSILFSVLSLLFLCFSAAFVRKSQKTRRRPPRRRCPRHCQRLF